MTSDKMAERDMLIYELKKRWNLSDSGLGRMFKLSRERISQIIEEQTVDNSLDIKELKK